MAVYINIMAFADDIVILAENTEDLIFLAENFINECKKTGLGVNDEKTKTIHFGRNWKPFI